MLESLSIKNIVLIDKLHLPMERGLCVLTGETGSGKSILLDALGLAIGYRSSARLLREGEKQGSVIAEFNISNNPLCQKLLEIQNIDFENTIILRRIIFDDGKSKAFINDIPVSQSFLSQVGETLIEVHGQSEQHGLLNPSIHRQILDSYGNLSSQAKIVSDLHNRMKLIQDNLSSMLAMREQIIREQDYLQHILKELKALDPKKGEEEELNNQRIKLMNKEKILDVLNNVRNEIEGQANLQKSISSAQGILNRSIGLGENLIEQDKNGFAEIIDNLEKSSIEINEALDKIEILYENLRFDQDSLDFVEARLFALRSLARKFQIPADYLPDFVKEVEQKLEIVSNKQILIGSLENDLIKAKEVYLFEAKKLSAGRKKVAQELSQDIVKELIPLKMANTVFQAEFRELDEERWSKHGIENVKFIASTNPGIPMNDLSKIASGGELSRFMLALKVVLSKTKSVPTIIFDEIDAGIGGAVAHAVGERLKKLGQNLQVFVVTHHPQVASKGNYHLRVRKNQDAQITHTFVDVLENADRKNEIARMLSGDVISDEALKTAEKLLAT